MIVIVGDGRWEMGDGRWEKETSRRGREGEICSCVHCATVIVGSWRCRCGFKWVVC